MADKSGVSAQALPLPKGGGALEGIGETFQADPYTGTGQLSVPIKLPEGRNGLSPSLTLAYSTGNPNGPFGLGWALSVPAITRKTSTGIPTYGDRDTFVLSGAEELVAIASGSPTRRTYRPRAETPFARIVHVTGRGGDHWEVETREGLRSWYGEQTAARVEGEPGGRVFGWLLTRTEDSFGNAIEYLYRQETDRRLGASEHDPPPAQRYLSRIRYVELEGVDGEEQFLYSVDLDYGEYDEDGEPTGDWVVRPDPFSSYRAGFEVRTNRRCRRLLVRVHEPGLPPRLVRSYDLGYDNSAPNRVSLLTSVAVAGYAPAQPTDDRARRLPDGTRIVGRHRALSLPALKLDYTAFAGTGEVLDLAVEGGSLPKAGLDHPDYELIDLDGFGLPGIIRFTPPESRPDGGPHPPHGYWPNRGGGILLPADDQPGPAVRIREPDVNLADMTGHGAADLVLTGGTEKPGFYETGSARGWADAVFRSFDRRPRFDLSDRGVQLVDVDGDGRVDVIDTRQSAIHLNTGAGWDRREVDRFDVTLGDERGAVRLADVSGDGPLDLVRVRDGTFEYWPHMGYGKFGAPVSVANPPHIGRRLEPDRVVLADVDGDGYADVIYLDHDEVLVWINQSGNGFSEPFPVRWPGRQLLGDSVRGADMLGTGTAGLLWSERRKGDDGANYRFLDLARTKPYLLSRVDNQMGAVTEIEYETSTREYQRDRAEGLEWETELPFPVQCVSRIIVTDALHERHRPSEHRRHVTEYRYHHGHFDGFDRAFHGFGRVDRFDTETVPSHGHLEAFGERWSAPLETRTWYHVGAVGGSLSPPEPLVLREEYWPKGPPHQAPFDGRPRLPDGLSDDARRIALRALRGRELRTEVYGRDGDPDCAGRPYSVSEVSWAVEQLERGVFFPFLHLERHTEWERGREPLTTLTATTEHDDYGQPLTTVRIGVPRGRDPTRAAIAGQPYLATITKTEYAQRDDAERYMVDRVARVAAYESVNDGRQAALDLIAAASAEGATLRPLEVTVHRYDGAAFEGLEPGGVGDHGVLVRTEVLAFTREDLGAAWSEDPNRIPPYFEPRDVRAWGDEYPEGFQRAVDDYEQRMRNSGERRRRYGGHVWRDDGPYEAGFYAVTVNRRYDFQLDGQRRPRGLLHATRDALGHELRIARDRYALAVLGHTNAVGLSAGVAQDKGRPAYDYGFRAPTEFVDENGNHTSYSYNPLGLLTGIARRGRDGERTGDAPDQPSAAFDYDFQAYAERGEPISVRTTRHLRHTSEEGDAGGTIRQVEFTDGLGRLLQTRQQADTEAWKIDLPAPGGNDGARAMAAAVDERVVVSGASVYDNKGRIVEQFEAHFGSGWAYDDPPRDGVRARIIRDPLGRAVRMIAPDGSEQRIVRGSCMRDLSRPDKPEPTPWETWSYDPNDNAARSEHPRADACQTHWDTPISAMIDALGRTVETVTRAGADAASWYATRMEYDVRGALVRVVDVLGRETVAYVRDRQGRAMRTRSLDAGTEVGIPDALGNPIEHRNANGAVRLATFDALGRPDRLWARDEAAAEVTLRERFAYGDAGTPAQPEAQRDAARLRNRLGRLERHYDEAGLLCFDGYDFKGNVLEKRRRGITYEAVRGVFENAARVDWRLSAFRVNWEVMDEGILEQRSYTTGYAYDALDRVTQILYPEDPGGHRRRVCQSWGESGGLRRVELDDHPLVERIAYNARGQRVLEVLGNGLLTLAAYDPGTFRLARLRTERLCSVSNGSDYCGSGFVLQDAEVDYDAAGNVLSVDERVPGCGVASSPAGRDRLRRQFSYDPLYRLVAATGRECADAALPRPWREAAPSGAALPNPRNAPELTAAYVERYDYDPAGNLVALRHHRTSGDCFVRRSGFGGLPPAEWEAAWSQRRGAEWPHPPSNRLTHMIDDEATTRPTHRYDPTGNVVTQGLAEHFEWDHAGRLRAYKRQTPAANGGGPDDRWAEPSIHVHYFYDGAGRRSRKVVRHQGGAVDIVTYIDDGFEHHRFPNGGENSTVHASDGARRVASLRIGEAHPDDAGPPEQFVLTDHLGSATVVADAAGSPLTREEYLPFGETSFGGFARKRYRFLNRERDEQSGLYQFGARCYAPWLARWTSPDPTGIADGLNLYVYARDNPVTLVDTTGTGVQLAEGPAVETKLGPGVTHVEFFHEGEGPGPSPPGPGPPAPGPGPPAPGPGPPAPDGATSSDDPSGDGSEDPAASAPEGAGSSGGQQGNEQGGDLSSVAGETDLGSFGQGLAGLPGYGRGLLWSLSPTVRGSLIHGWLQNMPSNNPGFDVMNVGRNTIQEIKTVKASSRAIAAAIRQGAKQLRNVQGWSGGREMAVILQPGAGSGHVAAAYRALGRAGIAGAVRTTMPGVGGLLGRALAPVGAALSGLSLASEIEQGDWAAAVGSGLGLAAGLLGTASLFSTFFLGGLPLITAAAAFAGAAALGYWAGSLAAKWFLRPSTP